jgi:hypothetical protein
MTGREQKVRNIAALLAMSIPERDPVRVRELINQSANELVDMLFFTPPDGQKLN